MKDLKIHDTSAEGSVFARHYHTGLCYEVTWSKGVLTKLRAIDHLEPTTLWLAPSLIDLQVNGYAGRDFQQDANADAACLHHVVQQMHRDGCRRFLLTLITDDWSILLERLRRYRQVVLADPHLRTAIVGWHIEGPFISSQPGFIGAHPPQYARDPSVSEILALRQVAGDDPLLLTLAPERQNALACIQAAKQCNIVVSFGHCDPSSEVIRQGIEAGALAFTHLGNGCPQQLDRHDNVLWRVLDQTHLNVGVIPDGIHVSPSLFRLMHKHLAESHIWWTTDAMAAAGDGPGLYQIGSTIVRVGEDGVVRHPTTGGFAGSALRPIQAIQRGAQMIHRRWQDCWHFMSTNPAKLMGLNSDLSLQTPHDWVLVDADN